MKNASKLLATLLLFSFLFTACEKDKTQLTDEETTQQMIVANEDNSTADALFQSVEDQTDGIIESRGGGGDCPAVTVDPSWDEFPHTITIDFGTEGCEGPDGRIRKGIITVVQSAVWWVDGATRTTTFTGFFVDGAQLEGTDILVNEGFDPVGNIKFSRKVEGAKITFPNGDVTTWESVQMLTQLEGGNTPLILLDNVFEFTADGSGVNRNGTAYSVKTITPLLKKKTCPWLVSGIIELEVDGKKLSLDHGNGDCDKFGTLTLPNGVEMEIELERVW